ncbi:Spc98 family-domain-containing protein [Echria macrotheca]|uniref:Spindle pole body component n=1 Tax=Echria macrotheca TaxID=438768 RepID=A0AAJ0BDB8_9PEZI|nr:Spc98 family-domain-containing protein [Echria macrotheca]
MAQENEADPFAIPDFWKPSTWLEQSIFDINSNHPLFVLDVARAPDCLIAGHEPGILEVNSDEATISPFFDLPEILKELTPGTSKKRHEPIEKRSNTESDIVLAPEEDWWVDHDHTFARPPELKTWDAFDQADGQKPATYITEAGPAAFDELVASRTDSGHVSSGVVGNADYAACLLNLALGRSSLLFTWDTEKKSFVKTAPRLRTSGLSPESVGGIDSLCMECADATKQLGSFVERTYSRASSPTRVALAGAVDQLVLAVQSELNLRSHSTISLLQLQDAVRPVHTVLTYVRNLVAKLAKQKSDEAILSCLFEEAHSAEYRNRLLQGVAREILRLVSKPWTDFVEEWVGLRAEQGIRITKTGPGKSFVKVADKVWIDDTGYELEEADYFLDEDKIPSFMPEDVARTAFEAGRNLRFLRDHHPDHPLSQHSVVSQAAPPSLEWQFDWEAITRLESDVNHYRNAVSRALRETAPPRAETTWSNSEENTPSGLRVYGQEDGRIEAALVASMNQLSQPLKDQHGENAFSHLLSDQLYPDFDRLAVDETLSPHWSLVPLLSFGPPIHAQSKLINRECMRMLFSAHELKMHLDLLKQYYLLSNGLLCSRLSHALFDSDLATAERQAGVALGAGTMGLRLGGRENWPPASSELRLALMGVLSESYEYPNGHWREGHLEKPSRGSKSDLPGELSFAVRDMSPDEVDRCMDPDSLEALDFLRLSYKAPSPLRPIITPTVLVKYDRIFMSLLRVQRMLYVVNQLVYDIPLSGRRNKSASDASLRFCIEARHFVHQIAAYFFETGVTTPWHHFWTWLELVEADSLSARTAEEDDGGKNYSPDMLRERQERVLDDVMMTLLLRKRQQPILKLLEETFAVILRFAKQLRHQDGAGGEDKEVETPEKLYSAFKKKLELFLTVCRGLSERTASNSKTQAGSQNGENTVEQLLLLMDMSGFYARKPSG